MNTNRNQIIDGPDRQIFLSFGVSECPMPQFQPMVFTIKGTGCGPVEFVYVWIKVEKIGVIKGSPSSVPGRNWSFEGVWIQDLHVPIEVKANRSIKVHGEYNTFDKCGWIEFDDMKVNCERN